RSRRPASRCSPPAATCGRGCRRSAASGRRRGWFFRAASLARRPGAFTSRFSYQPGSGALSESPFVQGRAALTLANFAESKKVATIGVSGHWGQSRVLTPVDRTLDSNGIALDFVLPFGSLLTVQGEAFTGTNL